MWARLLGLLPNRIVVGRFLGAARAPNHRVFRKVPVLGTRGRHVVVYALVLVVEGKNTVVLIDVDALTGPHDFEANRPDGIGYLILQVDDARTLGGRGDDYYAAAHPGALIVEDAQLRAVRSAGIRDLLRQDIGSFSGGGIGQR